MKIHPGGKVCILDLEVGALVEPDFRSLDLCRCCQNADQLDPTRPLADTHILHRSQMVDWFPFGGT